MRTFLAQHQEAVPAWLKNYHEGEKPGIRDVFASHVVYYPGSGNDGQPVHLFAGTHSAHVFFYVDYLLSEDELEKQLRDSGFAGYHIAGSADYSEADLTPKRWTPHLSREEIAQAMRNPFHTVQPYCRMVVFERNPELNDEHGAERFSVLFLAGDGIATYDAVFGNGNAPAPWAVVLQDHGFGGNYNKFGRDGFLSAIVERSGVEPEFLLVAEHTDVWNGYAVMDGLSGEKGGMHNMHRRLYRRIG